MSKSLHFASYLPSLDPLQPKLRFDLPEERASLILWRPTTQQISIYNIADSNENGLSGRVVAHDRGRTKHVLLYQHVLNPIGSG